MVRGFRVGLHTQNSVKQIPRMPNYSAVSGRTTQVTWQMPTAPYCRLREGRRVSNLPESVSVNSYCISSLGWSCVRMKKTKIFRLFCFTQETGNLVVKTNLADVQIHVFK